MAITAAAFSAAFFDSPGIAESECVPACHATYELASLSMAGRPNQASKAIFLHHKAEDIGVHYQSGHVTDVLVNEQGDIASVRTQEGETIAADLFVDCTGFAALLTQKVLNTPFVDFGENLTRRCRSISGKAWRRLPGANPL